MRVLNNLVKQREVKKVRNIVKEKNNVPTVTLENWVKHFSNLFSKTASENSTYELQALGRQYTEELHDDFTEHEVKRNVMSMESNKALDFDGILAEMCKKV
jgi:hypothetical protein